MRALPFVTLLKQTTEKWAEPPLEGGNDSPAGRITLARSKSKPGFREVLAHRPADLTQAQRLAHKYSFDAEPTSTGGQQCWSPSGVGGRAQRAGQRCVHHPPK